MFLGTIVAAAIVMHDGPQTADRIYETQRFERMGDCLLWADNTTRKLWYYDMVPVGAHCAAALEGEE